MHLIVPVQSIGLDTCLLGNLPHFRNKPKSFSHFNGLGSPPIVSNPGA